MAQTMRQAVIPFPPSPSDKCVKAITDADSLLLIGYTGAGQRWFLLAVRVRDHQSTCQRKIWNSTLLI